MTIRPMTLEDYTKVVELFQNTEGMTFRTADNPESTRRYLERNPGLSFVAEENEQIIGFIMAGHDGRRGYLQHLFVLPEHRRHGIANTLLDTALTALAEIGIYKSHLFVMKDNASAQDFWETQACERRDDVVMYSFNVSDDPNV